MKTLYLAVKVLFVLLAVALLLALTRPEYGLRPPYPSAPETTPVPSSAPGWVHIETTTPPPPVEWSK